MKKNLSPIGPFILTCALLFTVPVPVFAEGESIPVETGSPEGIGTPAMDYSLEEYAAENDTDISSTDAEDSEETEAYIPDELESAGGSDPNEILTPEDDDYKTIVGTDDRIIISDPSRYPYSAIAYMDVHARCGCTWTGTGFMVGPSGMLTASHCLVCTQHGQTADIIDYYFGLQPNGSYYYKYSNEFTYWYGTNFSVGDGTYGYTDQNMEWDYGYIKLQERVGDTTGWFGLSAKDDFTLDGSYYEVAGYRDWQLKSDINLLTVSNSNLVTHLADTQPGNSGGPIFDFDNYAVAINVAENNTLSYNVGRRITSSLINEMRSHGLFE